MDGCECNAATEEACKEKCEEECGDKTLVSSKCMGTSLVCDASILGDYTSKSLDCVKAKNEACALPQNFIGQNVNQTLLCECHANAWACEIELSSTLDPVPCTYGTAVEANCLEDGCAAEQCAPPDGLSIVQPRGECSEQSNESSNGNEASDNGSSSSGASTLVLGSLAAAAGAFASIF